MPQHIVIIGNGIAGITCAKSLRKKSRCAITIISSETEHFYSRTALMYIYMGHMKYEHTKPHEDWFWKKNNINLVHAHVKEIDTDNKRLLINEKFISYDILVIATGSVSNKPAIKGIELKGVQGLYGIPDLELMEKNTSEIKHAVIAGGGLIGIEMVEMLLSRNIGVTFLVREGSYWNNVLPKEESQMVTRHIMSHHVDLRVNETLKEIRGNDHVSSVITENGSEINCQFVGVAVGVSPNVQQFKSTCIEIQRGILVDQYFETNVPSVYAIGDCVEHRSPPEGRKSVEQVWYTGRIHGETLAETLSGNRTSYKPAPWFNSAKFFDIEYQTYGNVPVKFDNGSETFCWQHPTKNILLRLVFKDGCLIGFNALGMRLRHGVCDVWLREKMPFGEVIKNLHQINFDPEFTDNYFKSIRTAFNNQMSIV